MADDLGTAVGCRVPQREEDVVLHRGRERPQLGVHRPDRPEQLDRGVHQVRAEVEQQAAAARVVLLPAVERDGPPPLPAALEAVHATQRALLEQPAQGQLLTVPPPVLEHGERRHRGDRGLDDPAGRGGVRRERLVHDHGDAGGERGQGVRLVLPGRAGDDDEIEHRRRREQRPDVRHDGDAGPVRLRGRPAVGVRVTTWVTRSRRTPG